MVHSSANITHSYRCIPVLQQTSTFRHNFKTVVIIFGIHLDKTMPKRTKPDFFFFGGGGGGERDKKNNNHFLRPLDKSV